MSETESLYRVNMDSKEFCELHPVSAGEIDVKEKEIEKWVVGKPDILFSDPEAVMIIAQEMTGESQADVLAVDSQGNLIIVEIKRHRPDRSVIGQVLDYAARLSEWGCEQFNQRWKAYKGHNEQDLFDAFKQFAENESFSKEDFLKHPRLYILAPGEDENMERIISWLRDEYSVPIDFVPFSLFKGGDKIFLRISKIDVDPLDLPKEWAGDWFVNSNETHAPGAYNKMLDEGVIAAYGYGHAKTKRKMDLPSKGERVFVFLNGAGIIAAGEVTEDAAIQAETVFGAEGGDEYHRQVRWLSKVDPSDAVSAGECSQWGYNLPVRCTIGKMSNARVANIVAEQLSKRKKK